MSNPQPEPPRVNIVCPGCGGRTIPAVVLQAWARRRYIQCLDCYGVYDVNLQPQANSQWLAELKKVQDEYAFDIRFTLQKVDTDEIQLPF